MDEAEPLPSEFEDRDEEGPYRRRSMWLFRLVALLLAASLLAYFAVRPAPSGRIERLPDFELPLLGEDGETLGSADLEGAPVILNFWASWCIPCREEMPLFQRTYEKYKGQSLQVVGVDVKDAPDNAQAFVDKFGITYPIVQDLDLELLEDLTDFEGLPLTFFVKADGTFLEIDGVGDGPRIGTVSEEQIEAAVGLLLRGGNA